MPNPDLPPYRRAAPMITPDYSLNAAPRQVGRSMNDPERMQEIAMRRMRSQGDFAGAAKLAQNQASLDARFSGRTPPPMMPDGPATPTGAAPMPMPDYSLNAAPRQVGRSMNDPERMQEIAMRRMRSQGDFAGAAKLAQNQAGLDAPGLPPLEFGGAFANGGIAPPGKVSLVGERGPELIMPSGPTAVVPMGQIPTRAAPLRDTGSAMDRHMSTGLSGQPTRQVGRSMNDPQRMQQIAMRRLRSQGNFQDAAALAQNQAWLDARLGGGSAGPSPMPMQRPALPAMPGPAGKLVPGRSAGSMVWQPDAQPTMSQPAAPAMPGPAGKLVPGRSAGSMVWQPDAQPTMSQPAAPASSPPALPPLPMPSMSPPALPTAAMPIVPPQFEGNSPLTGLPLNDRPPMLPFGTVSQGMQGSPGMAPPPPGLYGEAPPLVSSIAIPGTSQMQPMIQGQPKGAPIERTKPAEAPKIPEGIQYEKDAMGKIIGGVYPTYNDQGKLVMRRIDLDGNGVVTPAEQAAAMQAAGQTLGGVKFSRVQ